MSDARNFGIDHSAGGYITCVDPDDYVDYDYVEYLYSLIEKYGTKMSICQHSVHFSNGRITDYGKEGDTKLDNKKCIEKMMYHDLIDTSAWAKLYKRELFEDVRYPVGKQFEDIATTYAIMLQCDKIAVGFESKYHYMINASSIVFGPFNPKKLDLLEMTDKMAVGVLKVYPDLEQAVLRRRVYSRFSTLNQMLDIKGYEQEKRQIIDFIRQNKKKIMKDPKAPRRDKIAIFLLSISYHLYRKMWKAYIRAMK